jgi:hypothetical protein
MGCSGKTRQCGLDAQVISRGGGGGRTLRSGNWLVGIKLPKANKAQVGRSDEICSLISYKTH